ncbi:MAG: collagenase-like PrtC family protease [Oleispira sp.]|jgi:collagenase-like PrtC family protease
MEFSMGNLQFYWEKDTVLDFYQKVADSSVEHVYLGESVCSKRRELRLDDWLEVGRELSKKGKSVVLSSLALLEAKSELATLKKVCLNGELKVEANDFGAVEILTDAKIPFVAGAALNIYNQHDLKVLLDRGMQRWVIPVELSRDWLVNVIAGCEELGIRDRIETEVYGYGYLPLAYSARCFTARSEDRPKDQCGLCCIKYPDGRKIDSQEGLELFRMNGIQTMSGSIQNLVNDLPSMEGLVDIVRMSPHSVEVFDWLDTFQQALRDHQRIPLQGYCNGYWHKIEGMKAI